MSYLPIDQETNTQAPAGQTSNVPGQTTGQPPPQTGSVGAGQAAGAPAGASNGSSTQFGSSASKLSDYLSANAPQITGQAQNVTNGLNSQYGQVSGDINNAAQNFGNQVSAGYTPENQTAVNTALSQAAGSGVPLQTSNNLVHPGGGTDDLLPTSNGSDIIQPLSNQTISDFQGQLNDQYTGPTNYEGSTPYSAIQNEVGSAVQNAGLLNTPTGLQNYLSQQGGGQGNATQASNTLDTLLYTGNPQANQQIQNAANQFQNLTPQLAGTVTAQDQAIANAQAQAVQAQQYAQTGLTGADTAFNTNLANELNPALAANTAYNTNVAAERAALQSGNLANAPGVNPALVSFLSNNVNPLLESGQTLPENYVNALSSNVNPQVPTQNNVATAQDYATQQALGQLGGIPVAPELTGTYNAANAYQPMTISDVNNNQIAQDILDSMGGAGGNSSQLLQLNNPNATLTGDTALRYALMNYLGQANPSQTSPYYQTGPGRGTIPIIPGGQG